MQAIRFGGKFYNIPVELNAGEIPQRKTASGQYTRGYADRNKMALAPKTFLDGALLKLLSGLRENFGVDIETTSHSYSHKTTRYASDRQNDEMTRMLDYALVDVVISGKDKVKVQAADEFLFNALKDKNITPDADL